MKHAETFAIWQADREKRRSALPQILAAHAAERPDAVALAFLSDGTEIGAELSFAELDRQARAIAAGIAECAGQRALLVYPSGLDYVVALLGCLYAGVVAVHAPLIAATETTTAVARLEIVAQDCEPALALAPKVVVEGLPAELTPSSPLASVPWRASDALADGPAEGFEPVATRETPALIQYTSGSTGVARGVRLSHAQLVDQACAFRARLLTDERTVTVGWAPLFHDLGLFSMVFEPLYSGHRAVIMPPLAFLGAPRLWLEAISKHRGNVSGAPNFAYELCVRRVGTDVRRQLDLSCWKVAFVGAEQVQATTLERFGASFADCGFSPAAFSPGYGLAEGACALTARVAGTGADIRSFDRAALATGQAVESPTGRRLVSVGATGAERDADHELLIADPVTGTRCPSGQIGEIWVRGKCVADGYWRRPEEEAYVFGARLSDGTGPFMRTGDLGFLLEDELFVVGRLKDLIIINGRNIFPEDVERSCQSSHRALRPGCGVAFGIPGRETERLVIVQELRAGATDDPDQIRLAIRRAVARDHNVDPHAVVLLPPGTVPKTTSGKLRRRACRADYLQDRLPLGGR